ncbi:hypothetical protein [Haloarcula argentinensis]|uniref:Uncharacterized protein n=1 Tax=Haloarcula argentinensis TaxID=43776 RepID=A0A830FJ39_HALAR|nr:hypothetical protein [Haloarcula argentinensis]GGM51862.1 hypothetical protein GCM10009006_36300 [Haloarcula argentinensis]
MDTEEEITWYLAGESKINGTGSKKYVSLPSFLVYPDESDRKAQTEWPNELRPPFNESDDLYWQYQTDTGTIIFSNPQLDESSRNPKSPQSEPRRYEPVGQGGYAINPMDGDGKIKKWVAGLPAKFFPEEYDGNAKLSEPVDNQAALDIDGMGWVVSRKKMVAESPYSCYLLRRNGEVAQFLSSIIRQQDEVVVLQDGFQEMDKKSIQNLLTGELRRGGGPRFM